MNSGKKISYMSPEQFDQFSPNEHSSQEPDFVGKLNSNLTKGRSQIPRQRSIRRKQESGEYIKSMRKLPTTMKRTYHYDQPLSKTRKIWSKFACCITIFVPSCCMRKCGLRTDAQQVAWREKISLVVIIIFIALFVGFLTFGFQQIVCGISPYRYKYDEMKGAVVTIRGEGYDFSTYQHPGGSEKLPSGGVDFLEFDDSFTPLQRDLSFMFSDSTPCTVLFGNDALSQMFHCTIGGEDPSSAKKISGVREACHTSDAPVAYSQVLSWRKSVIVYLDWPSIVSSSNYAVYNNFVLDLNKMSLLKKKYDLSDLNGFDFNQFKADYAGKDSTLFFNTSPEKRLIGQCFQNILSVARIDADTAGCIITDIVLYTSLIFIIGVVLIRFILAVCYSWFLSHDIGTALTMDQKQEIMIKKQQQNEYWLKFQKKGQPQSLLFGQYSQYKNQSYYEPNQAAVSNRNSVQSISSLTSPTGFTNPSASNDALASPLIGQFIQLEVMHVILLVTAYSEDEDGLRNTLTSLANTNYSDDHKLLLVICDGIIVGSGNTLSTPEIVVDMMELDDAFGDPIAYSYVSIADGSKRHNMAKIYAGWFNTSTHKVPMIAIIKTGTPEEANNNKPGNRGKRDSQIILMNFLLKVTFDDRMTPLEYDLFQKMQYLCRVSPDVFESCLMVDADTIVDYQSLPIIVSSFTKDDAIIGLCGETRISNKTDSWVSWIQVFEYYLAHHNAKAFESVFGGVTCLPGCFCAYRIKAPKGDGFFVPILGNPEIVEQYSENVVDTLHKKNLYLLGEDRFLSTIMLKTFPRRKFMFIPQALCKTEVPKTFKVLLSQRRRWINSTIHNLLELVLVSDLCGTFCISMQFVIFMELVGTVVLPAAIAFTIWLIFSSIFISPSWIPLVLLMAILGLPALLIGLTTLRWHYIGWMLIYLLSLPVWNFILPIYAFWHFDDFSWGDTRIISGQVLESEEKGQFDSSKIVMKRYNEWKMLQKRGVVLRDQLVSAGIVNNSANEDNNKSYYGGHSETGMSSVVTMPQTSPIELKEKRKY
eukprot:NODE_451_length_8312_cov_0.348594.p1 type:complete len:1039 gc:universal NODE_451_length_8312_cov_0.348594:1046-4162(+)